MSCGSACALFLLSGRLLTGRGLKDYQQRSTLRRNDAECSDTLQSMLYKAGGASRPVSTQVM
jgi:hypothetical protein